MMRSSDVNRISNPDVGDHVYRMKFLCLYVIVAMSL